MEWGYCVNKSYEQAVKEYILEPLNMHDTHISLEYYEVKRLVVGHSNNKVEPPFCWEGIEPAGLWRSTSSDMMKFLQAQLGNSGNYWRDIAIKTTQGLTNNTKVKDVGQGWMLTDIENIGATAWHNGRIFGQHSMCVWAR